MTKISGREVMKRSVNRIRIACGAVLAAGLVATTIGGADRVVRAQTTSQSQAISACEQELDYRMGSEAQSRLPLATIDRESVNVSQSSQSALALRGKGTYRRDNLDRARNFTFDCTYNTRTGRATASYKWGSTFSGGYDDPQYPATPSYRRPAPQGGSAYPPTGRVYFSGGIVNKASGKGLDVKDVSKADNADVQQWDFGGGANQIWDVIDQGDGGFAIISQGSGKALDVADNRGADGARVRQFRWHNGDNQLWRLERAGAGYFTIVSVSSGKCLDANASQIKENGGAIQQWSCSGAENQQWRLQKK